MRMTRFRWIVITLIFSIRVSNYIHPDHSGRLGEQDGPGAVPQPVPLGPGVAK